MTTPRSREEIEKEAEREIYQNDSEHYGWWSARLIKLILFVLLDIRDLLTKKNPTDL